MFSYIQGPRFDFKQDDTNLSTPSSNIHDTFSRSILTSQLYLLVQIIQDMAICDPVSNKWMFFLEHFEKTLKDFVR
jgi:hypothetical protein